MDEKINILKILVGAERALAEKKYDRAAFRDKDFRASCEFSGEITAFDKVLELIEKVK